MFLGIGVANFYRHYWELLPLTFIAVGYPMFNSYFIYRNLVNCDYTFKKHDDFPWNRRDLLRHPYCRKWWCINEKWEPNIPLHDLYKEMKEKEKELRKQARTGKVD